MRSDLSAVLFGYPVGHSRSPQLFAALAAAGGPRIDFQLESVPPDRLGGALDGLRAGRRAAAGITIPYKQEAAARVDALTPLAARAGAINALARRGDRLVGANTDGPGFLRALAGFGRFSLRRAVVLGAGGAARGVCAALAGRGVSVTVVSRRPAARADWVGRLAGAVIGWEDPRLVSICRRADLIVQATPLGMAPRVEACAPLPPDAVRPGARVMDLIYTPWETRFLAMARTRGAEAMNGWPMLVAQAAVAVDFWLGEGAGRRMVGAVRRMERRSPMGRHRRRVA